MSDKKISDLVELTSLAADAVLPVVDASANATKRITGANLSNFPTQPTFNGNDVYHQGNVVGTVSQSGGTPTGAVVERDSNANGEYVKFADGTLICSATLALIFTSNAAFVNKNWTYPETFSSAPKILANISIDSTPGGFSPISNGNVGAVGGRFPSTTSAFIYVFQSTSTSGQGALCDVTAIGRWF